MHPGYKVSGSEDFHWQVDVLQPLHGGEGGQVPHDTQTQQQAHHHHHHLRALKIKFDLYSHLPYRTVAVHPAWVQDIAMHSNVQHSPLGFSWRQPSLSDQSALRWLEWLHYQHTRPDKIKHKHWCEARPHILFTLPEEGSALPYRNAMSASTF
jgi:hypothetical protein